MTHYAEIDENSVVLRVIVAEQNFIDTQSGEWVQTSYNTRGGVHYGSEIPEGETRYLPDGGVALHKNFAGVGFTFADGIGFHAPQPFPSWILNPETYQWGAPTAPPDNDKRYVWDEESVSWSEIEQP